MKNIRRYDISLIRRPASFRGPRSSKDFTDTVDEIIRDLTEVSTQWNNGIIKLFTTLPDGEDDSNVDAFTNGIDGRTVYVDSSLTSQSSVLTYWHTTKERPNTLKEALDDLYSYVSDQIEGVQADLYAASTGLTDDVKARIGWNVFDNTKSSSSTSLDGKSENNRLNVIQLARDLYGTGYSVGNDGQADLTYSVAAMVDALLEAHGGNWDTDITLIHSGITVTQASINPSATYNDSFVGSPTTTEDDLNQIRTRIKTVAGTAAWTTALPALYAGGPDSLKDLLDSCSGSTSKSATNPWGYLYSDIGSMTTVLDAIKAFTGQNNYTDSNPNYSSNIYVTDGNSLETEIGTLDSVASWAATPSQTRSGSYFRRVETPLIGSGVTVTHNMGSYPHVEIVQVSPSPLISGHIPFVVSHTSANEFDLILVDRNNGVIPSGVISSGVVISCW